MRVLIACEFSGVVRRAFRAFGHDAWSCDLLPAESTTMSTTRRRTSNALGIWNNLWQNKRLLRNMRSDLGRFAYVRTSYRRVFAMRSRMRGFVVRPGGGQARRRHPGVVVSLARRIGRRHELGSGRRSPAAA